MSLLDTIRRTEYTGENRCNQCTIANSVILASIIVVVSRRSKRLALLCGAVGAGLIWFRGYFVPYTPAFAPKIAATLPFSFDHEEQTEPSDSIGGDTTPDAVLDALFEAGVLTDDGQLYLSETFELTWYDRMQSLRTKSDESIAAAAAAAAPFEAESGVYGNRLLVAGPHDLWLSRSVAIAETAAINALVESGVDRRTAAGAVRPLRMFLETCPACGGPVSETMYRNCCGGTRGVYDRPERTVLACEACDALLFEFDDKNTE